MADKSKQGWDWLTILGLVLTAAIIAIACWVVDAKGGITALIGMDLNNLGDFLAGFAGALALIWLVIAFFQQGELLKQNTKSIDIQQRELQNNNEILKLQHKELKASTKALTLQYEEMKKAAEQAAVQSAAIAANEMHARRDTFFRVAELHERELNLHAETMINAIVDARNLGGNLYLISDEAERWDSYGAGNIFVFVRMLLGMFRDVPRETIESAFKDIERDANRAARRYAKVFEKILAESKACEDGGVIQSGYEWCPYGEAYAYAATVLGRVPGFTYRNTYPKSSWVPDPKPESG